MKEKKAEALNVLFVCVGNAARSQMAEGFLRELGGNRFQVSSAGTSPHWRVDPRAVAVMVEAGVDITRQHPKGLEDVDAMGQNVVVNMGCPADACPVVPGAERREWKLEDPHEQPIEVYRAVRDEIKHRVKEMVEEFAE
jgi:arsenate reductase